MEHSAQEKCRNCSKQVPSRRHKFCSKICYDSYWKNIGRPLCKKCNKNKAGGKTGKTLCSNCMSKIKFPPPKNPPISRNKAIEGIMNSLMEFENSINGGKSRSLVLHSEHGCNARGHGKELLKKWRGFNMSRCPVCRGVAIEEPPITVTKDGITYKEIIVICKHECVKNVRGGKRGASRHQRRKTPMRYRFKKGLNVDIETFKKERLEEIETKLKKIGEQYGLAIEIIVGEDEVKLKTTGWADGQVRGLIIFHTRDEYYIDVKYMVDVFVDAIKKNKDLLPSG